MLLKKIRLRNSSKEHQNDEFSSELHPRTNFPVSILTTAASSSLSSSTKVTQKFENNSQNHKQLSIDPTIINKDHSKKEIKISPFNKTKNTATSTPTSGDKIVKNSLLRIFENYSSKDEQKEENKNI